jgi:hypothetical protein
VHPYRRGNGEVSGRASGAPLIKAGWNTDLLVAGKDYSIETKNKAVNHVSLMVCSKKEK